jgi:hypothetical protein
VIDWTENQVQQAKDEFAKLGVVVVSFERLDQYHHAGVRVVYEDCNVPPQNIRAKLVRLDEKFKGCKHAE